MTIDIESIRISAQASTTFNLNDFNYEHPEELVAQKPSQDRSESKLLVKRRDGNIEDHVFSNLAKILENDRPIILRNSTKVLNARLFGQTDTGASVEVFLLEPLTPLDFNCRTWSAIGKPIKKLKENKIINFANGLTACITKIPNQQALGVAPFHIEFTHLSHKTVSESLDAAGKVPLPPYIRRQKQSTPEDMIDNERYQTVYADKIGSVAAPTAGLHFTKDIENKLTDAGCDIVECTLHVGAGTFMPVKDPGINQHVMHREHYSFPSETISKLLAAYKASRPIMCVGTTSLRALESYCLICNGDEETMLAETGKFHSTDLFLKPINKNQIVKTSLTNILMTNFHQPESTLLMLVSALIGYDKMKSVYAHAVDQKYRLFSYGDSSLLYLD